MDNNENYDAYITELKTLSTQGISRFWEVVDGKDHRTSSDWYVCDKALIVHVVRDPRVADLPSISSEDFPAAVEFYSIEGEHLQTKFKRFGSGAAFSILFNQTVRNADYVHLKQKPSYITPAEADYHDEITPFFWERGQQAEPSMA